MVVEGQGRPRSGIISAPTSVSNSPLRAILCLSSKDARLGMYPRTALKVDANHKAPAALECRSFLQNFWIQYGGSFSKFDDGCLDLAEQLPFVPILLLTVSSSSCRFCG